MDSFGFQPGVPLAYGSGDQTPLQGTFTGQPSVGYGGMDPRMAMAAMQMMNQGGAQPGQRPNVGASLMNAALPIAMMAKQGGGGWNGLMNGLMGGGGGYLGPQGNGTMFGANNATGQMFGGQSAVPMMSGAGGAGGFGFGAMPMGG